MTQVPLTVVMYHYVRPLDRSRFSEIKALHLDQFRAQIDYIRRHYNVVSIGHLLAALRDEQSLPPRPCFLTFDDGYLDHYQYAFPILFDAKLPAAFYPPRSTGIERKVLDVNKVHFILASVADKRHLADELDVHMEAERHRFSFPSRAELVQQYSVSNRFDAPVVIYIKRLLQHALPEALRTELTAALFERYVSKDETAFAEELYMSLDQMRTMHSCGMHFGGHGGRHEWLSRLTPDGQAAEIDASTDLLDRIGVSAQERTFCYPYGDYNAATLDTLAVRGYRMAFTSEVGLARLGEQSPLKLSRLDTNDLPKTADAKPNAWTCAA